MKRVYSNFRQPQLVHLFFITFTIFLGSVIGISTASINFKGQCTEHLLDVANRDQKKPTYPLREDLRVQSSYIANANEILRKGLQYFLNFKELDLGTYLRHIDESNITFKDGYGREILSYYKVFQFIWQQYNETICENYAVKQFNKDKLDLCSAARYLSHNLTVEYRKTIMERMGHALNYTCHPCTPYKRREHGETIVPNTDGMSPVSPEDGLILCKEYDHGVDKQGRLILLSTTTSSTTSAGSTLTSTVTLTLPSTTTISTTTTSTTPSTTTISTTTTSTTPYTTTTSTTVRSTTTTTKLPSTTTKVPLTVRTTTTRATTNRSTTTSTSVATPEGGIDCKDYVKSLCANQQSCFRKNWICKGSTISTFTRPITSRTFTINTTHRPTTTTVSASVCKPGHQYVCANRQRCVYKHQICDGVNDCGDNSDENGCNKITQPPVSATTTTTAAPALCQPGHQYICGNRQRCVYKNQICDGVNDCGDNSDENSCNSIITQLSGRCAEMMMWEESNRDKQRPTFPLKEDLRIQTSNIVKAHEIIRKGLQQYLKLREADLGAYLSYIIQNNPTFVDEYGQEIPSYYKIFRFIWEQYNETVCQNYAVKQFDKDKLDLCGVARFLSHQPVVEDHQNIMKRMGHVLNYTCHPCTPYKRREYGEVIVPNTDDISPDGFSPRYSFILCKEYGVDEKGQLILLSTPTTSTTPVPGCHSDQFQCANRYCIDKNWRCNGVNDCGDNSDEYGCQRPTTSSPVCQSEQFQCVNRFCIDKNWRCNGVNDCGDNSDEYGCQRPTTSSPVCQPDQFQCTNKYCIDKNWRCNGANDCGDNSDENGCQRPTPPPIQFDRSFYPPSSATPSPAVTSALGPAAYGKTWFPYDCKITQNGNSYDKICSYKEVDQSQLGYHRQQLGPEISPHSPIQTIPFGYQACSGSSSITNKNGVFYSATVNENLCYRPGCNGCGTWFQTGSSTYRRTVTGG